MLALAESTCVSMLMLDKNKNFELAENANV